MNKLIVVLLFYFLINGCTPTKQVNSRSMEPYLVPGDSITVDEDAFSQSNPKRFEVVVLKLEVEPFDQRALRIVGLPGEFIEITEQGFLVDGHELVFPSGFTKPNYYIAHPKAVFLKCKLKQDEYYVLGDNPTHSFDSRIFGPIYFRSIMGLAEK